MPSGLWEAAMSPPATSNELGERGGPPDAQLDARIDVLAGDIAEAGQALARLGS